MPYSLAFHSLSSAHCMLKKVYLTMNFQLSSNELFKWSVQPNNQPTKQPTNQTSNQPNKQPINQPTKQTSNQPNKQTSNQPNKQATKQPTNQTNKQTYTSVTHLMAKST